MRPARPRRRVASARSGITLLETVLSVVLLGLAASALTMTVGSLTAQQTRESRRLACAELASRLMLMYMDDKNAMPSRSLPLDYDGQLYRWSLDESSIRARAARNDAADRQSERSLQRLKQVSVSVWHSEDGVDAQRPPEGAPTVTLSRIVDPLIPANPDAIARRMNDPAWLSELIGSIQNIQQGREE
jgi:type II secretory pathway pseudopilin PulG